MYKFTDLGITSDAQLRQIAKDIGLPPIKYIGFAEDMQHLPEGLSIINLGGAQGGTHWTFLYVDKKSVVYFDSYGVGPEDNIISLAGNRSISYNTKQIQRYEEEHCGVWALLAGKAIMDAKKLGISGKQAIDDFVSRYNSV